ncbi:MAG: hypothetical protein ACD_41C00303G0005 [uncultured bacterium]|nr:MAG: hypothetical protein ACD_41C00303G0005 [uncultured bacterium]HBY73752.1 hypothetical protein [Candidatus Kerfeldbacteria bacterium]
MKRLLSSFFICLLLLPGLVSAAGESTDELGDGTYVKKDFDYYFNTVQNNTRLGGYDDVANEGPIMTASLVINLLLGLLGTVALCLIVYAGFLWIIARGKEEDITKAKDILMGSVVGLLVILGSYSFLYYIFRSWVNITD